MTTFTITRLTETQARIMPQGNHLYLCETLTKLGMNFDGTKFGKCKAKNGLWERLRSHSTNCPFGLIIVLTFTTEAAMCAAESACKTSLPTLAWNSSEREYTSLTPEKALQALLRNI